ncbi:P-type conjugative transfer protein TrbL [Burkholderia vietnamiensis]|uniref:P-type conjugative transfer protein TrbL n=1 Tax=Burkholderia vietnamiensis TaxID=60552 RepID=UPI001CF2729C|nr:P-type conjugative transfer protein TrbL [Burkholderia vietnamiensis]MCA8270394.1 P-type conjugative transfer protein TrbL [Burkholderia vietnamiensis]
MRHASALRPIHWLIFAVFLVAVVAHPAHASNILDDIGSQYKSASSGWQSSLFDIAKGLFLKLALIEILWSGVWWVINRDEPDRLMSNVIKKLMGLMFFWAILLNFSTWIPAVIDGFSTAGQRAAGISALTPSTVLDTGLQLATGILNKVSFDIWSSDGMLTALTGAFSALLILISFTVIAGQMLVTLIESYIAISAGVLFLGFAGSRWTTTFAEKYISYTVSVGVKLFITYLIIGVGQNLAGQWSTLIVDGMKAKDYLPIVGSSIVYMFLCWQIPSLASSMLSGAVSMTLGGAAATAASVGAAGAGAVGMAAASVAGAVAAGKGVAGTVGGAAKLAGAASGAASASGASGPMSMISGAMGAVGQAVGGAINDGIKGLGGNSAPGRLAERINQNTASSADKQAMTAAGNVPAPSGGSAGQQTVGASPAPTGVQSQPTAPGGATGGSEAPAAAVPADSRSPIIDTSTSVAQAVQQRNAAAAQPSATAQPAASAPSSATTGGGESNGTATYPTSNTPPAPQAKPDNNKPDQTPRAPKTTLERMADSAKAMSQTPNDSGGGQGIQIDMRHHRD